MVDGTRNDGKLSRSVWSRGKAGDDFKRLPIATLIEEEIVFYGNMSRREG